MANQGGVGGGGNASGREVGHRQLARLGHQTNNLIRRLQFFGASVQLIVAQYCQQAHVAGNGAQMFNCMDHIASSGFALGANHGCAFGNAAQGLAQITCAANERSLEGMFVDMVRFISGREYLGLVNVVDA